MPSLPLEEQLHRLLDRFETQPEGRLFAPLADCYRQLGRLDEAYRICVDGLARHPRYSTGFVILGKIHRDRGESTEARTAFETVLSVDPENLVALRELALDAQEAGDHERARARWEQVLGLDPHHEDAARALEELGNVSGADGGGREIRPEPMRAEAVTVPTAESHGPGEKPLEKAGAESPDPSPDSIPEVLTAVSRDESLQSGAGVDDGGDEAETIITVTLADIYYEQGFKAKALEMYRTVLERHPEAARVAGLEQKVDQIESEMESLARRFQQSAGEVPEESLENLETPSPHKADESDAEEDGPADENAQAFRSWVQKRRRPES